MSNNIDLYIQEIEGSKQQIKNAIIAKGVTPTGGLTSYAGAISQIVSDPDLEVLEVTIEENGLYQYNSDADGYSEVKVNVDIPIPTFETQSKEVTIKTNGTTSIVPDSGYDGLSEVNVTVQVPTGGSDKPQILNGFRFTGGDIAQVDFSQYDWSMVYDTSEFFRNCYHSTGDWSNFEENFNGDILSLKHMFGGTQTTRNAGVQSLPNLGNKTAGITSTAYMCNLNPSLSDVSSLPQWDTSKVVDASFMFGSDQSSDTYNPNITSIDLTNFGSPDGYGAEYMFYNCSRLETVIGAHPAGNATCMFTGCSKLTSISQLDTSNVTSMTDMFRRCSLLTSIPQLNTSKVTSMSSMFQECSSLTSIPQLDTSNVTSMSYMFYSCSKLTTIPQLNTSKVTSMSSMFQGCSLLTSIPQLNTSKVTSMSSMFYNCSSLTTVPQMDVSNVTDFYIAFNNCSSLVELPDINSVKATSFTRWLQSCNKLQKLGVVDCDSATSVGDFFQYSSLNSLSEIGGWRNLGKASSVSGTNGSYFMVLLPNLTYESVLNVLNGLYDRASAGLSVLTLKLHANHLAMLSEDDIAIATNKGWTIV